MLDPGAIQQFSRAETAVALRHFDEALRLYRGFAQGDLVMTMFSAPADVRQGDILLAQGDIEHARQKYAAARRTWQHADADLRSYIARNETAAQPPVR